MPVFDSTWISFLFFVCFIVVSFCFYCLFVFCFLFFVLFRFLGLPTTWLTSCVSFCVPLIFERGLISFTYGFLLFPFVSPFASPWSFLFHHSGTSYFVCIQKFCVHFILCLLSLTKIFWFDSLVATAALLVYLKFMLMSIWLMSHRFIINYSFRVFHISVSWWFFQWSLSDSKSPQVSRTRLRFLPVLSNAVIWIVSTRPPTSKSSRPFNNPFVNVPKAPITCSTAFSIL